MIRKETAAIQKVSPSGSSSYSPWNTFPTKMVKTKCVKEMAKELFTLFSGKVNSVLAQAISNDENSVESIDKKGNIKNDSFIYSEDYDSEIVEQDEIIEDAQMSETKIEDEEQVNIDEI